MFLVVGCGGGEVNNQPANNASSQIPPGGGNPPPAPTVTISANPTSVTSGSASTLSWSSTNASSCTASGAWSGSKATSGSQSTGSLSNASNTFTLTCTGAGGSASDAVEVTVTAATPPPAPTVTISANPTSVTSGSASTLNWSSTNASSCTASGAWSGSKATSGSQSTGSLSNASNTFTLTCTGAGGSASDAVEVTVTAPPPPAPTVTISANPASVTSGSASTLNWSSTNASSCTASGAWSGSKATSGSQSTGSLSNASNTFTLTCTGAGGSASASAVVSVTAPPAPTVTISANPTSVTSGNASMLNWSSTNASSCTASGSWSGSKATSGSESTGGLMNATNTFTLTCNGVGGSASDSAVVTASDNGAIYGLEFPGSAGTISTMRFKFTNPLAIYPATYIWRAYPRQQSGYYTAFFWGNDDGQGNLNTFLWINGGADSYYGAHPYPDNPPSGNTHSWEISVEQNDFVNGSVVYDRWYTQAMVVWADANGYKHHVFYWDLPNTDANHRVERVSINTSGNIMPPAPALTWGDAPWAPGREVWDGMLRGIQVYSTNLSLSDILSEVNAPLSTSAGAANIWYLNLNPKPDDISDKSGKGHNPQWVGPERPTLWIGP